MAFTAIYSYINLLKKNDMVDFIEAAISRSFNTAILKVISQAEDKSSILLKFSKTKVRLRKNVNLKDKIQTEVDLALDNFVNEIESANIFEGCKAVSACVEYSNIIINLRTNTILIKFKSQ